jgi:hypothetical protein
MYIRGAVAENSNEQKKVLSKWNSGMEHFSCIVEENVLYLQPTLEIAAPLALTFLFARRGRSVSCRYQARATAAGIFFHKP